MVPNYDFSLCSDNDLYNGEHFWRSRLYDYIYFMEQKKKSMITDIIPYTSDNKTFLGYAAYEKPKETKRPCVLIGHALMGQGDFVREIAEKFAHLGYVGFALDMYSDGKCTEDREEAKGWMAELVEDPMRIRNRIQAAISCVKKMPSVDPDKIAIIGYCLGGACAIESVRANLPLKGAVSIHGVLGNPSKLPTKEYPMAETIESSLLILHGHDDPFVSSEDIKKFQDTMTEKKVDWQMISYSNTQHAFTNSKVNMPEIGLVYNEKTANRSWSHTLTFLKEIFNDESST